MAVPSRLNGGHVVHADVLAHIRSLNRWCKVVILHHRLGRGSLFSKTKIKTMMSKKVIIILWLGIILSCNKNNCPDGYICQDDKCICPAGSFETYGVCRPLEENEYYGVTDKDCPCQDSIILKVTLWENGKFNRDLQRGNSWTRGVTPRDIINDTIISRGNNPILGLHCSAIGGGDFISIGGYCVISSDKKKITFYEPLVRLTSNWENPDTCKIVFHK